MDNKPISQSKPMMLYLKPKEFNHLFATLDIMGKVDNHPNAVQDEIEKLKDTIMRFTRKKKYKGDDCASVVLFDAESCNLIKLLLFYIAASRANEPHDFFSEIRKDTKE